VAGLAWFALAGRTAGLVACVLGGYAVAVADGLTWLAIKRPPGASGYAIAALVLLTGFIAWIAARTVVLAVRGRLFPAS
jgi:hypothetical protein